MLKIRIILINTGSGVSQHLLHSQVFAIRFEGDKGKNWMRKERARGYKIGTFAMLVLTHIWELL